MKPLRKITLLFALLTAVMALTATTVPAPALAQTATAKANFISKYRAVSEALLSALAQEKALREQYDALDLGTVLVDGDFTGENTGISKAQFTTAVASFETIQAAATSGHRTNLYKLSK
jgi:hypothetical protein